MRRNLDQIAETDRFDYCIIGSGPAGVTCARELLKTGRRVLLLEGGADTWTEESQDLYRGEVIGDVYPALDETRLRFFGGSSNHWGGMSRPLDAEDFEARVGFELTEWPIRRRDLDPYLDEASRIIEIPPFPEDRPIPGTGLAQVHFNFSPPVIFSEKYGEELAAAPNLALVLNANLFALETEGGAVAAALVKGADGSERRVTADRYILAAGGVENSRLLLWSNELSNGALVKNAAPLGRYWMEHPHFTLGEVILDLDLWPFGPKDEVYFSLDHAARAAANVLGAAVRISPTNYGGTRKILADIACVAPDLARRFSLMFERDLACGAKLRVASEQEPRAENRVALAEERDALGMPRAALHWRKSAADKRAIQEVVKQVGAHLAATDAGRLRLDPWVMEETGFTDLGELAGRHHMGGTRMSSQADLGVVDANCKVHGQANLYIAGSSVFPSCGHANPTLTIVQLALRLADHLRGV